ncbi:HAD family hydrolase [Clostridium uliginosum]|uniref:Haloacid dehalogenase superfamily, subfamily IA, variant 3 with third motif having DD or ED/haloacid dehalogenase superfamily, subfamily IA, variant 1 with third motif having Dx(3-4)D or Dx(3-4)E n=1 Tax=Clostridium uliginosum TaxID=119641 RepID=A0A1I1LT71_9CLOT|nr:HAD family hydrolase [Clostridium uliginosum]SFC76334.1 haloacid dehalogenase superfamily, subfamily IA, variant 3 with third motif having DD or ED/haloacid dehalogenase superfamily, subfamily IA, variant 1 with third motif having Dx(3-4)D or Dx(3-4)E [Clostridium uliginosum]
MINWIIFDVDGTLIETALSNTLALQDTMKALHGKEYSEEELRKLMGIPGDEALRKIGIKEENITSTWIFWENKVKNYLNYNYVFEGVKDMLYSLNKKYSLAIVTSKTHTQLNNDLKDTGILDYFNIWICKEDTEKHKPNPDPLIKVMEKAHINPEEAIYLGDALVDYESAKSAGMRFAHCRYSEKTDDINCKLIFNKPIEITNYFIK